MNGTNGMHMEIAQAHWLCSMLQHAGSPGTSRYRRAVHLVPWGTKSRAGARLWTSASLGPKACTLSATSIRKNCAASFWTPSLPLASLAKKRALPISRGVQSASWCVSIFFFLFMAWTMFNSSFWMWWSWHVNDVRGVVLQCCPSLNRSKCCSKGVCTGAAQLRNLNYFILIQLVDIFILTFHSPNMVWLVFPECFLQMKSQDTGREGHWSCCEFSSSLLLSKFALARSSCENLCQRVGFVWSVQMRLINSWFLYPGFS